MALAGLPAELAEVIAAHLPHRPHRPGRRPPDAAVRHALTRSDVTAARELLDQLPPWPGRPRIEGLVSIAEGAISAAKGSIAAAGDRDLMIAINDLMSALHPFRRRLPEAGQGTDPGGPLRSLHLVSSSMPALAGLGASVAGLVGGLRRLGEQPRLVSGLGFERSGGLPGHRLDRAVQRLAALVDRHRIQVLHAHGRHDVAQVAAAVARARRLPLVYSVADPSEAQWPPAADSDWAAMTRSAETWCLGRSDAVLVPAGVEAGPWQGRGAALVPIGTIDDVAAIHDRLVRSHRSATS